ncbi:YaiO family outer membrane beta-barrel protein [Aquirufa aurantiipilula]
MSIKLYISLFFLLFCSSIPAYSQQADELFSQARKAAFEQKQYTQAKQLAKKAIQKSPKDYDIRIFLGRLYSWENQADSARREFEWVIQQNPDFEDAYVAYAQVEFWNHEVEKALALSNRGLTKFPQSIELGILKSKFLSSQKKWSEADQVISLVLKNHPDHAEARAWANRIRENSAANRIGLTYTFISFDKQFEDPWHLTSLEYSRQTGIGPMIGRFNYANRFNGNGVQYELDVYPRLSNIFSAYISAGYSANLGVFPQSRSGISIYANLPKSYEAEAGLRYLFFGHNSWIYTASLGKYYRSFWFNVRTYLSPASGQIGQSFAFTSRYYLGGKDDFISLGLNTGLSPDEQRNLVLINASNYKLQSNGISLSYRKSIQTLHVLNVRASWTSQEYQKDTQGRMIELGLGYIRRF